MPSNRNKGRSPLQRALREARSVFADCVNNGASTWDAWISALTAAKPFNLDYNQKCLLIRATVTCIRVGALVEIELQRDEEQREILYNAKAFTILENM